MVDKIEVLSKSPEPYMDGCGHLRPIVDYLMDQKGNYPDCMPPFTGDKSGPSCRMVKKIDWEDLLATFEFPPGIAVDPAFGIIQDTKRWISIFDGDED